MRSLETANTFVGNSGSHWSILQYCRSQSKAGRTIASSQAVHVTVFPLANLQKYAEPAPCPAHRHTRSPVPSINRTWVSMSILQNKIINGGSCVEQSRQIRSFEAISSMTSTSLVGQMGRPRLCWSSSCNTSVIWCMPE